MYYLLLYSTILTTSIFGIMQYVEKNKLDNTDEPYDIRKHLFTQNNMILFFMLFIVCTFILYYLLYDDVDLTSLLGLGLLFDSPNDGTSKKINIKDKLYDVKKNASIDPTILRRINDPLKYGFEPYSGGSDMSSNSNEDSSSDSDSDSNDKKTNKNKHHKEQIVEDSDDDDSDDNSDDDSDNDDSDDDDSDDDDSDDDDSDDETDDDDSDDDDSDDDHKHKKHHKHNNSKHLKYQKHHKK